MFSDFIYYDFSFCPALQQCPSAFLPLYDLLILIIKKIIEIILK